ncbi:alpha-D-ribose 1-methylphosphonate 5-triphosphate diphosphatase [Bartonella sp. HY406]|uniref:alpha-D-ribose 1-methylphosphonate 5-triphosphate diphosphatase n=1 Tax=Bartonella sp. HY406 TaxID=2979331 RepID=UPI0021C7717A|nr:alpha-D-ribose 1-methylphosphonate 5-triphosphate diphosphatase [Bartonella sp. HY406]UXN02944.1 alpha-D-ribose 1-methylphosphonate 5-triphosphate diphosphatase [Bartonella sp. HY406]
MPYEQVFKNAKIVLENEVIFGSLQIKDGKIANIDQGKITTGTDVGGDYLVPGLIELHTDNIEGHLHPRPKVRWNTLSALHAHDMQICGAGITTVFDSLRVGNEELRGVATSSIAELKDLADTIAYADKENLLKAEHFIHLRCEVSLPDTVDIFDQVADNSQIRLASLMDHAPGQRQFATIEAYKIYYQGKYGISDSVFEEYAARRVKQSAQYSRDNRLTIAQKAKEKSIILASHDDATTDHVSEGLALGVAVSEFPTTLDAAIHAHKNGLHVLMGAPNIVRGKSHSGNISASYLLEHGCLDILSSDYVPFSLLHSVFAIAGDNDNDLATAMRYVSANPATAAGLYDRGILQQGRRADLLRVRKHQHMPIINGVWREGQRVA